MVKVTYDNTKLVKLTSGVFWCWLRAFGDKVSRPSKFGQGLEVSGSVVTFAFVNVEGAKTIKRGSYVMVEVNGYCSEEDNPADHHYYIMTDGSALFPAAEVVNGGGFSEYLTQKALVHFTEEQREEWAEAGKLTVV